MNNDEEILINPYTAIRLFARIYRVIKHNIFKDRKFKTTREAWIASMFLISLEKHTNTDWWLTPVRRSGSPDFNCYAFTKRQTGGFDKPLIKLEVFEWREEDNETDFLKALKKIKLDKIVDPQLTIVCYIRKTSLIPAAIKLNAELKKINPKVKDIWYLGDVSVDSSNWRVTQIYPNTLAIDLDYDEILYKREKQSFIRTYRGSSDKLEYEPTDKQIQLTPEFEIKILEKTE